MHKASSSISSNIKTNIRTDSHADNSSYSKSDTSGRNEYSRETCQSAFDAGG